jgi:FkbM family methyltransferase
MTSGLDQWSTVHSARRLDVDGVLALYDGIARDWHLLRIENDLYAGARISLTLEAKPTAEGATALHVNCWGGRELAFVTREGRCFKRGAESILVRYLPDGWMKIGFIWQNNHRTVSFGTARTSPLSGYYRGDGQCQWLIRRSELSLLGAVPRSCKMTVVDVGAREGIDPRWAEIAGVTSVLIEPDPEEAARLRHAHPQAVVIAAALSDDEGSKVLYLTRMRGCSSLLRPDDSVLSGYPLSADWFEIESEIPISCRRYDQLVAGGEAPVPDVLKLDVQGYEFKALRGFGDLLQGVVGIELETHLYPIYRGQKLLGDIISHLDGFDLALRALRSQSYETFGRECVELNAYFTRRDRTIDSVANGDTKRQQCEWMWGL